MKTESIKLLIKTNCPGNSIDGIQEDRLKIKLHAIPEKGKANKELIKFLSKKLKIPKTDITIISGLHSNLKTISVSHDKDADIINFLLKQ